MRLDRYVPVFQLLGYRLTKEKTGLVPSNYLTLIEDDNVGTAAAEPAVPQASMQAAPKGATATAVYDYEAGEDNELSFPENATITNVVSVFPTAPPEATANTSRHSLMKTGGTASITERQACSHRTMSNSTARSAGIEVGVEVAVEHGKTYFPSIFS